MQAQMLAPAAVLVAWSLVMLFWMAFTRFPAIKRSGAKIADAKRGARGQDLDGVIEDAVQWKAHNYNHLLEQPTIFYAIAISLALLGGGDVRINVWLAWGYVALRILHSLIQATTNVVRWRFLVFSAASLCLLGLTVHAAARVLYG